MTLLIIFILIAVVFSFLCSIAEAVILSVPISFIISAERRHKPYGRVLRKLKENINSPLAVILTLNTIAHTMGAAGAGAQATAVFGNAYLGVFSGILTFVILVFSEIIPKALGAHYWRNLAPATGYTLGFLVRVLRPFVWLSNRITSGLADEQTLTGFSRREFAAMAALGEEEGQLNEKESQVLQNLFLLREIPVREVMTPRVVVFGLQQDFTASSVLEEVRSNRFSRFPIYSDPDDITGYVRHVDLLIAQADGKGDVPIKSFSRELIAVLDETPLMVVFERLIEEHAHIFLVVDEYGTMQGIVTMEDILETLLGLEITDETDAVTDRQKLAKRWAALRHRKMGSEANPENNNQD